VWPIVAIVALVAKNVVRTRAGRAMQAVRDRDLAAEVVGVPLARTKVSAFAISSAFAGVAGALLGSFQLFAQASQWDLFLSIQFLAIIIVGGIGTIYGPILGALAVAGSPRIIERYSGSIPFIASGPNAGGLSIAQATQLLYGILIVFFLIVEPHGLAGVWRRIKTYFTAWPFSY
jgi:branched-chain amino acid transport system permease protein